MRGDLNKPFSHLFIDLVKNVSTAIEKLEHIEIKVRDMESNIAVLKKNGSDVSNKMDSLETMDMKLIKVENNTSTFDTKIGDVERSMKVIENNTLTFDTKIGDVERSMQNNISSVLREMEIFDSFESNLLNLTRKILSVDKKVEGLKQVSILYGQYFSDHNSRLLAAIDTLNMKPIHAIRI